MNPYGEIKTIGEFEELYAKDLKTKQLSEEDFKAKLSEKMSKLEPIPDEKLDELTRMNRKQRRAWYAEQRRKK